MVGIFVKGHTNTDTKNKKKKKNMCQIIGCFGFFGGLAVCQPKAAEALPPETPRYHRDHQKHQGYHQNHQEHHDHTKTSTHHTTPQEQQNHSNITHPIMPLPIFLVSPIVEPTICNQNLPHYLTKEEEEEGRNQTTLQKPPDLPTKIITTILVRL